MSTRVPNFTYSEKSHLFRIIAEKYACIIEDKKTDRTSVLQKKNAWTDIEADFNATSGQGIFRSSTTLKKCYENRKKELRKTLAEERRETNATGGGPPPKIKKDESDELLMQIVNNKSLLGLKNPFDDDADLTVHNSDDTVFEVTFQESCDEALSDPSKGVTLMDIEDHTSDVFWNKHSSASPKNGSTELLYADKNQQPTSSLNINNRNRLTPRSAARRRPSTVVKTLTSSDIAHKYNLLIDKRLTLIDMQLKHHEVESALIIRKHKLEIERLELELNKDKNK